MALEKTFNLPNGATGNYVRIGMHTWDGLAKEASAHLVLHTSAAQRAANPSAHLGLVAKLRLTGQKFDDYLSTTALRALESAGPDPIRDQLYAAAKTESLVAGSGLTSVDLSDADDV